ncbi:lysophospholipid acyltransferase family protein [Celerinatantimonas sp. YJH-8]|uniref:lysophospholipid acyltransferase family protein n=1 Tax=Celerinatantimonas sp. YJH-8 TaxID=3228714 RepID=UPI0038C713AC
MFSVDEILQQHFPTLQTKPRRYSLFRQLLKHLLYEEKFQTFEQCHPQLTGLAFIEQVFTELDFSYQVSNRHRERIPSEGPVIIVANHPIGSLDGLALLHLVSQIRSDAKIVANQILSTLKPLDPLLLTVDNMSGHSRRAQLTAIHQHLDRQGALIIFPAGEVSRIKNLHFCDRRWQRGVVKIADKSKAPILPVCVKSRNSSLFYLCSMLNKSLSTLMLVRELFWHRGQTIQLAIGDPINYQSFSHTDLDLATRAQLLRKHTYRIGAGKPGIFKTESAIAHPQLRHKLNQAIACCELLGNTPDGQQIYLSSAPHSESLLAELGRLREYSFRAVGEGTGQRSDTDQYDAYYMHLFLWNPTDQQIVGAYRLTDSQKVIQQHGLDGLYSHSLFEYQYQQCEFLQQGLELGRSFIQPQYWGRRSLDYLWLGIGAFLASRPHYRYLFGPVSISASLHPKARDLLVYFYQRYFPSPFTLAKSRNPYQLEQRIQHNLSLTFQGNNYLKDFTLLKAALANMGCAIPTLYKQYTDLCHPGGVQFIDFNIDTDFKQCVDGLVLVDLNQLKPQKRQRYIDYHRTNQSADNHEFVQSIDQ